MNMSDGIEIIPFPKISELNRILSESRVDIVSPFYSAWALQKLTPKRHSSVRFITRLPTSFSSPPPFLDNNPRPLAEAMSRLGDSLIVYGLPNVHAKLYLTATSGWLGSANFTRTGFSGIAELLLRFTPPSEDLRDAFNMFRNEAVRVTDKNVEFLVANVQSGLTRLRPDLEVGKTSRDAPIEDAISYDDFEKWLVRNKRNENAGYIVARIHNKFRMSGHAYSGFHGTFSFLSKNPEVGRRLLNIRRGVIPGDILDRVSTFVQQYGGRFGGPRGGTWRSKLSVRLGGIHTGGGAGDTLVKRLLIEVARYMRYKDLL